MRNRFAFTMIELIFVIVIMGIIGKFGVEFLAQAYKSFLYAKVNHKLQSESEMAVEMIASRLQYRIKDSVIARTAPGTTPVPIGSASGTAYTVLEWIGSDSDGFRGLTKPYWSGILDLNDCNASTLSSPDTNTTAEANMISNITESNTSFSDSAIYFVGSNSDAQKDYGWDGNISYINQQKGAIHPITSTTAIDQFISSTASNFSGVDLYEYYKLAWTAYAIVMEDYNTTTHTGTLRLYYNYQPWKDRNGDGSSDQFNDNLSTTRSTTIMENVSSFKFMSIGSVMKIQVCTKSDVLQNNGGDYSLCKEKTIL